MADRMQSLGVPRSFSQLKASRLAIEVASYICEMIFSGQLTTGSHVQPQDLAEVLGVSTTPVREALILLEKEGLVRLEPRRGFSVSRLTRTDIRDAFSLSAHIESTLAQRSMSSFTEEDLDLLERLEAMIARETAIGEPSQVGELNRELHQVISRGSEDSHLLHGVLSSLWRFRPVHFYSLIPGWIEATRHTEIIAALRAKDSARLDAAVRDHTTSSCDLLIQHLEASGFFGT